MQVIGNILKASESETVDFLEVLYLLKLREGILDSLDDGESIVHQIEEYLTYLKIDFNRHQVFEFFQRQVYEHIKALNSAYTATLRASCFWCRRPNSNRHDQRPLDFGS